MIDYNNIDNCIKTINYNNIDKTIFSKIFGYDGLNRITYINGKINIFEKIDIKGKKTYKLVFDNNIIFDGFGKNKALKILNNGLNYCKKENFNGNIDGFIKSMIF